MSSLFGLRGMAYAALVVVGLLALAVIARNWSCRHERPPRVRTFTADVDSVPNGASIVIKTGWRQRRTAAVALVDLAAPSEGDSLADDSRTNLARLAGSRIRIESSRAMREGSPEPSECDSAVDPEGMALDLGLSALDFQGVVYGESGENLCLAQLRAGLARNQGQRAEWIAAAKAAQEARQGIWAGGPIAEKLELPSWKSVVVAMAILGVLGLLVYVRVRSFSHSVE